MIVNTDIDIDVADRKKLLELIPHTPAMIEDNGRKRKHNTGVYFHKMPEDPFTGLATVNYKDSEQQGYFKLDILNVNVYDNITSNDQLDELIGMEPMWELLEHEEVVKELFHIHSHFNVVKTMRPRSVEELAAVLAMIRPAKRHLVGKDWDTVFASVWTRPENDDYYFKKAHATAYAFAIVLQLNMMVNQCPSSQD